MTLQIPLFEQFGAENAVIARQMAEQEFRFAPPSVKNWAATQYMKRLEGRTMCADCRQVPGTVLRVCDGHWLCQDCARK